MSKITKEDLDIIRTKTLTVGQLLQRIEMFIQDGVSLDSPVIVVIDSNPVGFPNNIRRPNYVGYFSGGYRKDEQKTALYIAINDPRVTSKGTLTIDLE